MSMKTLFTVASAVAAISAASVAQAGFTAQSGNDTAVVLAPTPGVGNTLAVNAGTFATYAADGPADPQLINGGGPGSDLSLYGYTLNVVGTAPTIGGSTTYTGTYEIFYNTDGNDTRNLGDLRVSQGTATLDVNLVTTAGGAALQVTAGELSQVLGAENPAFRDLSYGGSNVGLIGFINIPLVPGTTGTANLTFRQNAVVPEPTTMAAIAGAGIVALRRRRA